MPGDDCYADGMTSGYASGAPSRFLVVIVLMALIVPPRAIGESLVTGERFTLPSKILKESRSVFVALPESYERSRQSLPVLYLTDAQWQFDQARSTTAFLARNGEAPEVIVVGVTNSDRTSDLYATHADFKQGERVIPFPTSGHADQFLEFLEKELIPWVEAKYRVTPLRILAGHSAGGNFALHVMRTRPELFQAVIAASPWLSWDDSKELKQLMPFVESPGVRTRALFLTRADDGPEMKSSLDQLVGSLHARRDSTLRWDFAVYPGETHDTGALKAYYDGLRWVFAGWSLPRDPKTNRFTGTLRDLQSHYERIGDRLGCSMAPPEWAANELGYQLLNGKSFDDALAAFLYNTKLYPQSPNVWDSLGDGLSQAGKRSEAAESYEKAVSLAASQSDPNLSHYQDHLAKLKQEAASPKN